MGRYKEATARPTSHLIVKMSPKITLVYFNNNVRARTECARLTLAYGAVPHTFADCQTFFGCSFPETRALCDMVYDTHHDLFKIMPLVNLWSGEKFEEEKAEFFNKSLPSKLPALVKMLGEKQYFCGNFVTYGDFAMYNIMDLVRLVEPEALKAHTNILEWMARIECLPGVKEYLAGRPECVGIGTNPGNKVDGKIVPKF